jgi:hypothetical protein
MSARPLFVWLLLAAAACSTESTNAAGPDATEGPGEEPSGEGKGARGPEEDAPFEPSSDAGKPQPDAGKSDAGDPNDILGTLSGTCGTLGAWVAGTTASLEKNGLLFVAGEAYVRASLSAGAQTIFDTPNAGGSSVESEVMSFEVLHFCEGASLVKTETQIGYALPDDAGASSITDILVSMSGRKIGVSVTRVYKPSSQTLTDPDVKSLLEKKLIGVNRSSVRVLPADKWDKQILHVFTANKSATDAVARVYPTISAQVRADTLVLVTQTQGGGFVYCNPDPPLGSECP